MMGERPVAQDALFYEFSLERHVPVDHLVRSVDRFVDLSAIRDHLRPFYSETGRPSIDPELMIRMLIVGYCFGIRQSEDRARTSISSQSGLPLVPSTRPGQQRAGSLHLLQEPPWSIS